MLTEGLWMPLITTFIWVTEAQIQGVSQNHSQGSLGEVVLGCRANADPQAGAGGRLLTPGLYTGMDFTACIRFQFERLARTNVVLRADAGNIRPLLQLEVSVEKLRVAATKQYRYFVLDTWLRPHRWYLVCIMYRVSTAQVTAFMDGKKVGTKTLAKTDPEYATDLTVGFMDPSWYPGISFIGNVTQFNLWDKTLSGQELMSLGQCRQALEGNVVSWSKSDWTLRNVEVFESKRNSLCYIAPPIDFQVFNAMAYDEGSYLCEAIGGELKTPSTLIDVARTYTKAQETRSDCPLVWAGVTDVDKEGRWMHHHNDSLAIDLPWAFDEPNGLTYENCGGIDLDGVIDDGCTSQRCPLCTVAAEVSFTMRGSCEEFVHNMNYMMKTEVDERTFIGYGDYLIYNNGSRWVWINNITDVVMAEMIPSRYDYPVGRKMWFLHYPICREEPGTVRPFLLTVCPDGSFTCDDGKCIPLSKRCNLQYDCRDNSDEAECKLIILPIDYKSYVAPRPGESSPGALGVGVEVTLETIQVDTPRMQLRVGFNISLSWMETRAIYVNLKDDLGLNQVDGNQTELWYPGVTFVNTVDNEVTVIDKFTRSNVLKNTTNTHGDKSLAREVLLYPGWGNPIVTYRKYLSSFTCDFDLTRYPFDSQTCYLLYQLSSAARDNLEWDVEDSWVRYDGSDLLLEYSVGKVTMEPDITRSVLKVRVPLSRRFGYAVINIYLPSLIMAIVGYLTLFFLKNNFEVRVMTALTSLLVLATISNQVAASLPKSSNFKLVDVWLLFCIFSTFMIIVFHIFIDLLQYAELSHTGKGNVSPVVPFNGRNIPDDQKNMYPSVPSQFSSNVNKMMTAVGGTGTLHKIFGILKLTTLGMEKFARVFVAIVFVLFNCVYWLIAYATK